LIGSTSASTHPDHAGAYGGQDCFKPQQFFLIKSFIEDGDQKVSRPLTDVRGDGDAEAKAMLRNEG
jgi:hypothetical protein